MKILFFYLLSILLFINTSIAQSGAKKEPPDKIAHAFAVRYPSLNIKKWSVKKDIYTVNFISDNTKSMAFYDSNGGWIRTETLVSWKLPLAVKKGFYKSQFAAWFVETIKKYETPEKTFYRFLIDNGDLLDSDHHDAFLKKYSLDFSTNGESLRSCLKTIL